MTGLSKTSILAHRQCAKWLWLHVYRPDQERCDALLTYCERDTWAMVTIARFLATGRKPRALR